MVPEAAVELSAGLWSPLKAPLDVVHLQAQSGGHHPDTVSGQLSILPSLAGQLPAGRAASLENQASELQWAGEELESFTLPLGRAIPFLALSFFFLEATHRPASVRAGMTQG